MSSCKSIFLHGTSTHDDASNTKFGNKMFGGLEDIIWANINILILCCNLDLECSNPTFVHMTLWLMMMYHQTKFDCQGINSSENIVQRVIFLIIWALNVTLTLKIATTTKNSAQHSSSLCCIIIPNLVTKCSVIQKISSRQTFTDTMNRCCDLEFKRSNPIFPQDSPAYDAELSEASLAANWPAVLKIQQK